MRQTFSAGASATLLVSHTHTHAGRQNYGNGNAKYKKRGVRRLGYVLESQLFAQPLKIRHEQWHFLGCVSVNFIPYHL
jgi:hypothetical protein